MAVGTTFDFDLPVDELIEEAFELVGSEFTSGIEYESAVRSLNFVLRTILNKNYPLSQQELVTINVSAGTTVPLAVSPEFIDIQDMVVRRNSIDYTMTRIDLYDYHKLPNKSLTGLPSQYAVNTKRDNLDLYPYLTPVSGDSFRFWAIRKTADVSADAPGQNVALSDKYHPALVFGLAAHLGAKRTGFPMDKLSYLESKYKEYLYDALMEDRNKSNMVIRIKR